jgi:predicted AAA+ superfamily ATPase
MRLIISDLTAIYKGLYSKQTIKYTPPGNPTGFCEAYIKSIQALTSATSPQLLTDRLLAHYKTLGCGITAKYIAFKYDGSLEGVSDVDLVSFDSLVGIDYQRNMLVDNTRAFINGHAANNVLLFGDRGTGKSSSVKALLNMFKDDGLRLIEVPKQYIKDIPRLSKFLSTKPHKYIIFLDDLSFETHESEYRALKIAMDGQLQANPKNVIIYATSNRRHLIRETWADRDGGEVHRNDQMQETMSLAERFGLSLVFSAPNQKEYLNIVSSMLREKGIEMTGELEKKAIVWQMNYGGRNGRCAKQFVASLDK